MKKFNVIKFAKLYENQDQRDFAARFQCGIPKIRDVVFQNDEQRRKFDDFFIPVVHNLEEANFAKERCIGIIDQYKKKLEEKSAEYIQTGTIEENISFDLNMFFKDFFIRGKMAIDNTVKLASFLGFTITFFFAKNEKFEEEFNKIPKDSHDIYKLLAQRVSEERNGWLKDFQDMRNKIEHHGFQFPSPQYSLDGEEKQIGVSFMKIEETFELSESLQCLWINLFELCEDIIVFFLATKIVSPQGLKAIAREQRNVSLPLKYEVVLLPDSKLLEKLHVVNSEAVKS